MPPLSQPGPRDEILYLIDGGWHTEVGLSRAAAQALPAQFTQQFRNARYLVFGWGERDYYMAAHPGPFDVMRALVPGPAVTLVIPLAATPEAAFGPRHVLALPVSEAGIVRVSTFLWNSIAKDRNSHPLRAGPGPDPGSEFLASTASYDIAYTCNTWTAEALSAAGLPIDPSGMIFAGQVMRAAVPFAHGPSALQFDALPDEG
ncbi:MAG: DUF2459 domain-containing protein [Stellaceae bacterium]